MIDEPHLIRVEVFAQLHTLLQFDFDSKPLVPLILCGQNTLLDKLMFHSSRPLASCVIGRSHLEELTLKEMRGYLNQHLKIAGIEEQLFAEEATLAISRDQEACFEGRKSSTEGTWTETGYDDSPG